MSLISRCNAVSEKLSILQTDNIYEITAELIVNSAVILLASVKKYSG